MIVIKIEMWPQGEEHRAFEIGRMLIHNRGNRPNGDSHGDYGVRLLKKNSKKVLRTCTIDDYPKNSYTVWELVRRALNKLYKTKMETP